MAIIITVLHLVACFILIVVVLLQTGKGADIGAVFGGSSQTIFGSSGAGNLLTRLTTWTAVAFMLTSLFLTWNSTRHLTATIVDSIPTEPPAISEPAAPEGEKSAAAQTGAGDAAADAAAAPSQAADAPAQGSTAAGAGSAAPGGAAGAADTAGGGAKAAPAPANP